MSRWSGVRAIGLAAVLLAMTCNPPAPPTPSILSNAPSARTDASSAYDPATRTVVLFGGADRSGVLGDTWTWDSAGWHQVHPTNSPPAREFAWMGFDPTSSRVVMFGGVTCLPPTGNVPTGCDYQQAVTSLHDTWTWDGSTWSRLQTAHSPASTVFRGDVGGLAGDPGHHQLLLVTWPSESNATAIETWVLDGGDWTELHPASPPFPAEFSGPAYDAVSGHVVLQQEAGETYWWDGSDWKTFGLSVRTPHSSGTLVAIGSHGLLLIFGTNVYSWNGQSWTDVHPLPATVSVNPPFRDGWTASYYEPARQLILFGGRVGAGGPVLLGDTLASDGSSWRTIVAGRSSPAGALHQCLASEAVSGYGGGPSKDELIEVDFYIPASGPCHLSGVVTLTLLAGPSTLAVPNNPATQAVDGDLTAEAGGLVVTFTDTDICSLGQVSSARIQVGDFDVTIPMFVPNSCTGVPPTAPPIGSSVRRTPGRP